MLFRSHIRPNKDIKLELSCNKDKNREVPNMDFMDIKFDSNQWKAVNSITRDCIATKITVVINPYSILKIAKEYVPIYNRLKFLSRFTLRVFMLINSIQSPTNIDRFLNLSMKLLSPGYDVMKSYLMDEYTSTIKSFMVDIHPYDEAINQIFARYLYHIVGSKLHRLDDETMSVLLKI